MVQVLGTLGFRLNLVLDNFRLKKKITCKCNFMGTPHLQDSFQTIINQNPLVFLRKTNVVNIMGAVCNYFVFSICFRFYF